MTDVTLTPGATSMERARTRRRTGILPLAIAALLGFAFVLGFGQPGDPVAARVALALASAGAAAAILLLGQVVLTLVGRQRLDDGGDLPTRERLETEKRQILLAIKELDFDRAMGKINVQDHAELKARYEAEAFRVLKAIDDERARWEARAEEVARRHLKQHGLSMPPWAGPRREAVKAGLSPDGNPAAWGDEEAPEGADAPAAAAEPGVGAQMRGEAVEPAPSPEAVEPAPAPGAVEPAPAPGAGEAACPACGTENDADARFCKHCGARLTEAA